MRYRCGSARPSCGRQPPASSPSLSCPPGSGAGATIPLVIPARGRPSHDWLIRAAGAEILKSLGPAFAAETGRIALAAEIALGHHERWDGTGYPDRLAGEAIPLAARVFAVADTLDALTTDRPYRTASSFENA